MGKLLFWLTVAFVVMFVLRLVNTAKLRERRRAAAAPRAARPAIDDTMVRCVRCGTFVPRGEARPGPSGLTCGDVACLR